MNRDYLSNHSTVEIAGVEGLLAALPFSVDVLTV